MMYLDRIRSNVYAFGLLCREPGGFRVEGLDEFAVVRKGFGHATGFDVCVSLG